MKNKYNYSGERLKLCFHFIICNELAGGNRLAKVCFAAPCSPIEEGAAAIKNVFMECRPCVDGRLEQQKDC